MLVSVYFDESFHDDWKEKGATIISGYEEFKEKLMTESNSVTVNKVREACCSRPVVSLFYLLLKCQVQLCQ